MQYRCPLHSANIYCLNPLMGTGNYSATSNNMKLVHWPLMGGLLHLVQRGGAWAHWGPAQSPPHCTGNYSAQTNCARWSDVTIHASLSGDSHRNNPHMVDIAFR